ncbi:hypothetical protein, partial [Sabulibacter ruber]|uniref:hypothetical protein n=1 Tax=Sabulibacter ruber TaxID=2811901 RepID=UPI001A9688F9
MTIMASLTAPVAATTLSGAPAMARPTGHAPTYYAATAAPVPPRPALEGDATAQVCVIGAGFTGISAA